MLFYATTGRLLGQSLNQLGGPLQGGDLRGRYFVMRSTVTADSEGGKASQADIRIQEAALCGP